MEKITIKQFLSFTNIYVPLYIEDEFQRYKTFAGDPQMLVAILSPKQKDCPIDYIRNVDGGHFGGDDEKKSNAIVLGIGIENYEKYFGKE